jgi:hypothetical protein
MRPLGQGDPVNADWSISSGTIQAAVVIRDRGLFSISRTENQGMIKRNRKPTSAPGESGHFKLSNAEKAIALLDQWLSDQSGYDEQTWPALKEALDRDRLCDRRLIDAQGRQS